jgi:hypothetical protein
MNQGKTSQSRSPVESPFFCYKMFPLWTGETSLGLLDPYTKTERVQVDTNIPLNSSKQSNREGEKGYDVPFSMFVLAASNP